MIRCLAKLFRPLSPIKSSRVRLSSELRRCRPGAGEATLPAGQLEPQPRSPRLRWNSWAHARAHSKIPISKSDLSTSSELTFASLAEPRAACPSSDAKAPSTAAVRRRPPIRSASAQRFRTDHRPLPVPVDHVARARQPDLPLHRHHRRRRRGRLNGRHRGGSPRREDVRTAGHPRLGGVRRLGRPTVVSESQPLRRTGPCRTSGAPSTGTHRRARRGRAPR